MWRNPWEKHQRIRFSKNWSRQKYSNGVWKKVPISIEGANKEHGQRRSTSLPWPTAAFRIFPRHICKHAQRRGNP